MGKKIAVLGCGWLGLPLAKHLAKQSFKVNGSTTSIDKIPLIAANNIAPFLIQLNQDITGDDIQLFLDVDILIINIPPGRAVAQENLYEDKLVALALEILKSSVKKIVFISSTSVYPEVNDSVDETFLFDVQSPAGQRMINAENIIKNIPNVESTIIRMAGLIGPNRHPGRFFAGKENVPDGLVPVNLIHLDDCLGIIEFVINENLWGQTFNAAAPLHPKKADFYSLASLNYNGSEAKFLLEKGDYKIVNSSKISNLGFQFKHPDLIEWLLQNPQS